MSNRKINDLPIHAPEDNKIVDMATFDNTGVTRRIRVDEYVYSNEEEAIERIKLILSEGFEVFIMPFKP